MHMYIYIHIHVLGYLLACMFGMPMYIACLRLFRKRMPFCLIIIIVMYLSVFFLHG